MFMDVYLRYRIEVYDDVVVRFNERFIFLFGSCDLCLVIDDELNVLLIFGGKGVKVLLLLEEDELLSKMKLELEKIKDLL